MNELTTTTEDRLFKAMLFVMGILIGLYGGRALFDHCNTCAMQAAYWSGYIRGKM